MKKQKSSIFVHCSYAELVDVSKIKPHPRNPNRHPKKQIDLLCKILLKHGWRVPLTISNRSGFLIRGHGRLEAAIKLGQQRVPVDFQDYETEADELADVVADNRIAELSEMNKGELRDILSELSENIELDSIGFDIESLSEYVNVQDLKASDRIIHARFDEIIVEVTCETEREAETLYTDLKQKGMKCRILTL